jgi:aspartyl-tRNA(Asn)/glutamyl-tRNA(Gln) amidotransferase subunit A
MDRRTFVGGAFSAAVSAVAQTELHWLTIEAAAALVRRRRISPVELTRAALERIERFQPALNAFITVTGDAALDRARELETEQSRGRLRGPLHGIPIGLKDLYDTAGVKTTAASAQYAERVPTEDAEVVRRLREAGAVIAGKLNMDQFAYSFTSETSHFGPIHNPWKSGYSPGGSSGGSGAAVAAGLCYGTLGSDTGGSIRLPAALCGIVGFKPTYGVLPADGVVPLAWSLDHVGPMCRSVEDVRLMLAGMGMPAARPARNVKGLRIGIPRAVYFEQIEAEVAAAVEEAIGVLGRLAAGTREVRLPPLRTSAGLASLPDAYGTIITAEAYTFHEEMLAKHAERYHPATRETIELGAAVKTPAYVRARLEMDELRRTSGTLFAEADLLAMPAAPGTAFPLGSRPGLIYLRNLAPWNLYGLPAISVPCGYTRDGLPIGLQIVGPAGQDALVLAAAQAYEKATPWDRRPL